MSILTRGFTRPPLHLSRGPAPQLGQACSHGRGGHLTAAWPGQSASASGQQRRIDAWSWGSFGLWVCLLLDFQNSTISSNGARQFFGSQVVLVSCKSSVSGLHEVYHTVGFSIAGDKRFTRTPTRKNGASTFRHSHTLPQPRPVSHFSIPNSHRATYGHPAPRTTTTNGTPMANRPIAPLI